VDFLELPTVTLVRAAFVVAPASRRLFHFTGLMLASILEAKGRAIRRHNYSPRRLRRTRTRMTTPI